jgi:hypothetical protein
MHIFNVSITTVQDLKNFSLTVWEELIAQSRYPMKDACTLGIHQSISQMHFVQPGQKFTIDTDETVSYCRYGYSRHQTTVLLHVVYIVRNQLK